MKFDAFIDSLSVLWKGMLGIFIVVAIIVLTVYILNALGNKESSK